MTWLTVLVSCALFVCLFALVPLLRGLVRGRLSGDFISSSKARCRHSHTHLSTAEVASVVAHFPAQLVEVLSTLYTLIISN